MAAWYDREDASEPSAETMVSFGGRMGWKIDR